MVSKERRLEIILNKVIKHKLTINEAVLRAIKYNVLIEFLSSININIWIEDFIDEDTKEIVSIKRHEIKLK